MNKKKIQNNINYDWSNICNIFFHFFEMNLIQNCMDGFVRGYFANYMFFW